MINSKISSVHKWVVIIYKCVAVHKCTYKHRAKNVLTLQVQSSVRTVLEYRVTNTVLEEEQQYTVHTYIQYKYRLNTYYIYV